MAEDILKEIVAYKRLEVEHKKQALPLAVISMEAQDALESRPRLSMKASLQASASGIIAEFKRRSPSKGWIKESGSPLVIPHGYSEAGAAAISILADEKYFGGSPQYISLARDGVACPILFKEFVIDEYQIFEAAKVGADAVLLIAADLSAQECRQLAARAHSLGLETLLEVHSVSELDHLNSDIDMVGVNNRCLGTFHTDVETSFSLAAHLPSEFTLVSESGISKPETVRLLRDVGYRGFLIGETFMRQDDPASALKDFIKAVEL